jgi:hypothetical protein
MSVNLILGGKSTYPVGEGLDRSVGQVHENWTDRDDHKKYPSKGKDVSCLGSLKKRQKASGLQE